MENSEPSGYNPEILPISEKKEIKKPTEVVRIFLFQSKAPNDISPKASLKDLQFTQVVLIEKNGKTTNGQLMAVGGNIDQGESLLEAVQRETREETHNKSTSSTTKKMSEQAYSYTAYDTKEKTETTRQRLAHIFVGRMLPRPMDIPYVLNGAEDKIGRFVNLDIAEFTTLLRTGQVVQNNKILKNLDSFTLQPNNTLPNTQTDQTELKKTHNTLIAYSERTEADKKMSVLEHLIWGLYLNGRTIEGKTITPEEIQKKSTDRLNIFKTIQNIRKNLWLTETNIAFDNTSQRTQELVEQGQSFAQAAQAFWQEQLANFQISLTEIKQALESSNAEGVRDYSSEFSVRRHSTQRQLHDTPQGRPTAILITPLLNERILPLSEQTAEEKIPLGTVSHRPNFRLLRTLFRHPQMARIFKVGVTLSRLRKVQNFPQNSERSAQNLAHQISRSRQLDPSWTSEKVSTWTNPSGIPPEVEELLTQKHKTISSRDQKVGEPLIEPELLDEFKKLGSKKEKATLGAEADGFIKQFTHEKNWERLRISPVVENADFSTLLDLAFDGKLNGEQIFDARVRFEAARKLLLMSMLYEARKIRDKIIEKGIEPINALFSDTESHLMNIDTLNKLVKSKITTLKLGEKSYQVQIDEREKSLFSLLRKIITRDDFSPSIAEDLYGKAIVFKEADILLAQMSETTIPYSTKDKKDKVVLPTKLFVPNAVKDIMETALKNAASKNENIFFANYKVLPDDKSTGPGGSGKVHMIKFDICHIEEKNGVKIERLQEMQVFLPREIDEEVEKDGERQKITKIVSGEYDYHNKKIDDSDRYGMKRLFSTKSLRSFMELMFPVEIYGELARDIFWNPKE